MAYFRVAPVPPVQSRVSASWTNWRYSMLVNPWATSAEAVSTQVAVAQRGLGLHTIAVNHPVRSSSLAWGAIPPVLRQNETSVDRPVLERHVENFRRRRDAHGFQRNRPASLEPRPAALVGSDPVGMRNRLALSLFVSAREARSTAIEFPSSAVARLLLRSAQE